MVNIIVFGEIGNSGNELVFLVFPTKDKMYLTVRTKPDPLTVILFPPAAGPEISAPVHPVVNVQHEGKLQLVSDCPLALVDGRNLAVFIKSNPGPHLPITRKKPTVAEGKLYPQLEELQRITESLIKLPALHAKAEPLTNAHE
jgi:hypothetical protein